MRKDCIINVEKGRHTKDPVVSSKRRFDTVSCGHSETVLGAGKRAGKHGRYPTSPVAMDILMRALKSQGLWQLREADSEGAVTVADICGTPSDRICGYFEDEANVILFANDLHPSPALLKVAQMHKYLNNVFFTNFDACSDLFPVQLLEAISQTNRTSSTATSAMCDDTAAFRLPQSGRSDGDGIDYIISSPPYDNAVPIIRNALSLARVLVAMKLPVNFICAGPTLTSRRQLLAQHPPSGIIPMCQADNNQLYKTRTDEAWFIWLTPSPRPRSMLSFIFPYNIGGEGGIGNEA
jgi:hypothetical protein